MDEIEGLAKGSRCKKFKTVKGVRRCASFMQPRKSTKKSSRKGRRPANKGKVCVRYKSVDGVRRCAKFGTKSAAKKRPTKKNKKASRSKAKKPSKSRQSSGAKAAIEVPRAMGVTSSGKLLKGCRPKAGAKGMLLCKPEVVARMFAGGLRRRSAQFGRSMNNMRFTEARWGANVR